mgnify:CR=1 FL=1
MSLLDVRQPRHVAGTISCLLLTSLALGFFSRFPSELVSALPRSLLSLLKFFSAHLSSSQPIPVRLSSSQLFSALLSSSQHFSALPICSQLISAYLNSSLLMLISPLLSASQLFSVHLSSCQPYSCSSPRLGSSELFPGHLTSSHLLAALLNSSQPTSALRSPSQLCPAHPQLFSAHLSSSQPTSAHFRSFRLFAARLQFTHLGSSLVSS